MTTTSLRLCAFLVVSFSFSDATFSQWPDSETRERVGSQRETCDCAKCRKPRLSIPGWRGTPYEDPEIGGCKCSRQRGVTYYNCSAHWTSPANVILDLGRNADRYRKTADTTNPRPRDVLDRLAGVKLINYRRRDNGHTGRECDPWGKLSDSRRGIVLASEPEVITTKPVENAKRSPRQASGFGWIDPPKK